MPTWIIETDLNAACEAVAMAAEQAGQQVLRWSTGDPIPVVADSIFLGSLTVCPQMPGTIGDPVNLQVSHWLELVGELALNQVITTTAAGSLSPATVPWSRVFVRPDSAMKPFSGRVLDRAQLSPAAIDLGFYFEDPDLPIVLAEAIAITNEWRFVAVAGKLVATSGYVADGRETKDSTPPPGAVAVAQQALDLSPEPTVVIDICQTVSDTFKLVEYNLFSGADLYGCDPAAIVAAFA